MITAVALPAIVVDLADWTELRAASWIINGYLLVSILVMPLAGQLADRHGDPPGVPRGARRSSSSGSVLAGRAASLGELIAARLVQAVGGGSLVPGGDRGGLAPVRRRGAAARARRRRRADLPGDGRGPVRRRVGDADDPPGRRCSTRWASAGASRARSRRRGATSSTSTCPSGSPRSRSAGRRRPAGTTPRREHRLDLSGAAAASIGLAALLLGITLAGSDRIAGPRRSTRRVLALGLGRLSRSLALVGCHPGRRRSAEPFIDASWFRSPSFASATLVSLLTGYGFATAIIGGAVFVDRVLYGGPDLQRVALGSLAAATAAGRAASPGSCCALLGLRAHDADRARGGRSSRSSRMAAWTPGDGDRRGRGLARAVRGWGSG